MLQIYIRFLSGESHFPCICKIYCRMNTNTYLINWLSKKKLTLVLLFRFIIRFWYFLKFLISPIWHSVQENLLDNNYSGIIKRESIANVRLSAITITDMQNTTTWKVNNTFILEVVPHYNTWINATMKIIMNTKVVMSLENNTVTSRHKYNNSLRKCDIPMISLHMERYN